MSLEAHHLVTDHAAEHVIDAIDEIAIVSVDRSGRVASWNHGARNTYHYAADEAIGGIATRILDVEDLLAVAREAGAAAAERWQMRKNGVRFWARIRVLALQEGNDLRGYIILARDIGEHDAETQEHFRILVESVSDYAIFMLDPRGFVKSWNPGAERIKGYRAEEILGQHFSKFYPAPAADALCAAELEVALRDGRFEDEGWRVRKDGSLFWANVIITPLHDRRGVHIGFAKITRDLTERRKAEHDRLRLAQAEEALRLRDEFLSIAAHELRTPLVALQLQLDSLCANDAGLDERLRSKVDRAARNAHRLGELIAALLDVSRIATGQLTIAPATCELDVIVRDAVERLADMATAAGCTVALSLERGIRGQWDPLRIGQVMVNSLSNAFKYAARAPVEITLTRVGDVAEIQVADHGPGIPEDARERIFERFERAASSRHYGGMGIGLYVARQIVNAHGGTIDATNRACGGATLNIRLPIRDNS